VPWAAAQIGVAGAEVDYVDTARGQFPLLLRNGGQRVLRQRIESTSDFWH
jgi:hypothetical protein